ncbi:MAG: hypothetical protein IH630_01905 [Thermoplasmata archaeon]|nr:hypothetical protein [Thermoplasmata archaeon]TFG68227.1 MAG: hypothetical protein E4H25_06290 [Methanomassiliicoccus sp.]
MFCVECGAEDCEIVDSLCRECYAKKHVWATIPDHVDLIICAHCSHVEIEGRWKAVDSMKGAMESAVIGSISIPQDSKLVDTRVTLRENDPRNFLAQVNITLASRGANFERAISTLVRFKRGSCNECSKKMGNYFEAILQVRGTGKTMDDEMEQELNTFVTGRMKSMKGNSRDLFISKIERVKGGLDFYFSKPQPARNVARELQDTRCAEYKESSSMWGMREGEEVSRMTYLIRMPGFDKGDIIEYDSKDYFVRSMSKGSVHGIDLKQGDSRPLKMKDASDFRLSVRASQIRSAIVLIETDKEVQVLDPETMIPLDLRKPVGFVREGEQVRLVKTRLGVYVLSDSW